MGTLIDVTRRRGEARRSFAAHLVAASHHQRARPADVTVQIKYSYCYRIRLHISHLSDKSCIKLLNAFSVSSRLVARSLVA